MSRGRRSLPAIVIAGLLLVLTFLLVRSAAPDGDLHQHSLDALRGIILGDAALQRDVLKARAGLLRNYDPLVEAIGGLREGVASLRITARAVGDATVAADDLDRHRERLAAVLAAQEELIEAFKSRNALLQNSLSYFRLVSRRLGMESPERDAVAAEVAAVANAMLSFMGDPGGQSGTVLAASLDRLAQVPAPPGLARDLRGLMAHGRLTIATLPEVDEVLDRILAIPMSRETRAMEAAYLDYHAQAEARARIFRILLYLVSLLLLVYLSYLFLRLRGNARTLEARLRFEQLIAGISARFIDLPHERVEKEVGQSLARLAGHLGADRAYVVWHGGNEAGGRQAFRWPQGEAAEPSDRLRDLPAITVGHSLDGYERDGCILVPRVAALPAGPERASLEERGARSWLCVPLWQAERRVGLLGFETVQGERRWLADDAALLRTAGEIFSSTLEREQAAAERKALEARLRQAERMEAVGTLAGGIAHDFNNILAAILGYAEMALYTLPSDGQPSSHVRKVMAAGERARGLVDQILAFSRRSGGELRPVRIQAVVEEAVDLLRASLPTTITLHPSLEAGGATVLGDPGRLQQVVINLSTNAAQAMDGRGIVAIALDPVERAQEQALSHGTLAPGRYVRLAVSDTGRGIDPATVQRVFEPFFTTRAAGTGLGLASVHGIVAEHGGALNVRSRPGEGSTFEAYFARVAGAAEAPRNEPRPLARGNGETVLLVDDEQSLVLLVEEMLAALGYEPVGLDSATKALAAFRGEPARFDLVLADEVMPEMTGTELAAAVHAVRPELPILLMTGNAGPIQPHRLRAAGIREVLRKPFVSRTIAEALSRQLRSGALPP
ncbi:MAG TPA: two-component system VirA-like sensor kinase [Geminicoccaceae bacterium]|nr:two-component system VirA-like sensor kinase [Geminicoccus sp.]HMU48659.1 two-component system VirA-like sensor kinase [Geminicoccaceae bacterium]